MNPIWLPIVAPFLPVAGVGSWVGWTYLRYADYHRYKGTFQPLGPVGFMSSATREIVSILALGAWTARAWLSDGLRTPAEVQGRPVLCVHGFSQNGTNFWGMRLALEAAGRPTRAVSMGRLGRPLHGYLPNLVAALRELDSDDGIDVICHSMGGVVLRMALAHHPELAVRIRGIVTLGSPHYGTAVTRGIPKVFELAELSRRSTILSELPGFSTLAPHATVTTIAASHDLIVYPCEACHLPGSRAVRLEGIGHAGLLARPEAIGAVLEALGVATVAAADIDLNAAERSV